MASSARPSSTSETNPRVAHNQTTEGGNALRFLLHGIYGLIDPARVPNAVAFTEALLAGGIRLVQVRAKGGLEPDLLRAIVTVAHAAGAAVIVNDDVRLALLADGVHLGQEDAAEHDLTVVRRSLGTRLIGLSCGTPAEARRVDPSIVDYIGTGPMFATATKSDAGGAIGASGVRAVVRVAAVPVAAIGGIGPGGIGRVRETGAAMAAVSSALVGPDPQARAAALVRACNA